MTLYCKLAIRNLRRHWRASLAAILSVTAGFFTLVLFEGYIEQNRRMMLTEFRHRLMFGDVMIEKQGLWSIEGKTEPWKFRIDEKPQAFLANYLDQSPLVKAWTRTLTIGGIVANGRSTSIFWGHGMDLKRAANVRGPDWYENMIYGRPLEEADANSVLLGQLLAKTMGCLPQPKQLIVRSLNGYPKSYPKNQRNFSCEDFRLQFSTATPSGQVSAIDLQVAGFIDGGYREVDSKFLLMPLERAQTLANSKDVTFFSIILKNNSDSKKFIRELREALKSTDFNLTVLPWSEHPTVGDLYRRTTGLLNIFRNFVIVVILCIATLSILNTMVKIVKERTRDIGTWRSLGFNRRQVLTIFVFEAVLLALVGNLWGAVVTLSLTLFLNSLQIFYTAGLFVEPIPFSIALVGKDYFLAAVILSLMAALATAVAIRSVLRQKVSENLIYA